MTDRELLELAAKASGIWVKSAVEDYQDSFIALRVKPSKDAGRETTADWNPLTDDGDALRLAAGLLIDIEWATEYVVFADGNFSDDIKNHGNDRAATIRSVVVRAAAYQGKAMP